jgi:hypothetical protein
MDVQSITNFIEKKSSPLSLSKSKALEPKLTSIETNFAIFKCPSSNGSETYFISAIFQKENLKSVKCTCIYEGVGICKHSIAALYELVGFLEQNDDPNLFSDTKELLNIVKIPPKNNIIPTKGGEILFKEIDPRTFSNSPYYYMPLNLVSIEPNKLVVGYGEYHYAAQVTYCYDEQLEELTADCTCKSQKPCFHKYKTLEYIVKVFGVDYFRPDFLLNKQHEILKQHNLLGKINFDEVFELNITQKGVSYNQKVRNILSSENPIAFFDKSEVLFQTSASHEAARGHALCVSKTNDKNWTLKLVSAKRNTKSGELSSNFSELRYYDMGTYIEKSDFSTEEMIFLMKAAKICSLFAESMRNERYAEKSIEAFKIFRENIELIQKFPVFLNNKWNSMTKKYMSPLHYAEGRIKPVAKITESEKFYDVEFKIRVDGSLLGLGSAKIQWTPIGLILDGKIIVFESVELFHVIEKIRKTGDLHIIKEGLDKLRRNVIDPLSKLVEVDFAQIPLKSASKKTKITKEKDSIGVEKQVFLSDAENDYIVLQAAVLYGNQLLTPLSEEKVWSNESDFSFGQREVELEQEFVALLRDSHPSFSDKTSHFFLTAYEAIHNFWLMEFIDKMEQHGVKVFGMNKLKNLHYNLHKPTFNISVSSKTDWFDMEIDVSFGDQKVSLLEIQKAIVKRTNFVELGDGTIGILPKEWIEKYKKYFQMGQVNKNNIEISNFQFSLIDELYEDMTNAPTFLKELYEKKKRLANLKEAKPIPLPKGIKATLRPYQNDGLNWLVFLHDNQLGGCLADDMGLGKTLQTITFLQYLKNEYPNSEHKTSLVVAPTSLMFNWKAELEKFAPKLSVMTYTGANRGELKSEIAKHDIMLTTYGSIINDIREHQKHTYHYVILDESQAIKNAESQRFKSVRLLKSWNRLVLTGTPIENNTFDLYSQFNFLNPGFFGSVKHFKATFSDAIDKEQDAETSQLLAKMIAPFLLRRTKAQVATDLPPKTEAVIYCEMGTEQRRVYDYFKEHFREKLREQIEKEGVNKSQVYILQGLTKLRQICNSTELADKERDFGNYSTKLDELVRHLKEKVGNHKVLVFSQFVGMLDIVQRRLNEENIVYEYLDGQTRNRQEKVENFQNNSDIRVFLISLKAGGTGLNLTEADYVYLIDPWWNPAVENQAIDRCYRIGQNKSVMAYRMICKDTIEEKIVKLQDRKRTVAADVIQVDNDKKKFNMKDVEHLFA